MFNFHRLTAKLTIRMLANYWHFKRLSKDKNIQFRQIKEPGFYLWNLLTARVVILLTINDNFL